MSQGEYLAKNSNSKEIFKWEFSLYNSTTRALRYAVAFSYAFATSKSYNRPIMECNKESAMTTKKEKLGSHHLLLDQLQEFFNGHPKQFSSSLEAGIFDNFFEELQPDSSKDRSEEPDIYIGSVLEYNSKVSNGH